MPAWRSLWLLVSFVAACARPEPGCLVQGTVTFDGAPIERGSVIFMAVDNKTTAGGGTIEDGRYALRVLPGPKRVMISASRQVAGGDLHGEKFYLEGYVPRCYNEETTLRADVVPDGENRFDFALTSQPRSASSPKK